LREDYWLDAGELISVYRHVFKSTKYPYAADSSNYSNSQALLGYLYSLHCCLCRANVTSVDDYTICRFGGQP
jgi:hypothetical protein